MALMKMFLGEAEMIAFLEKVQKKNSLVMERWPGHSESPPRPSLQIQNLRETWKAQAKAVGVVVN